MGVSLDMIVAIDWFGDPWEAVVILGNSCLCWGITGFFFVTIRVLGIICWLIGFRFQEVIVVRVGWPPLWVVQMVRTFAGTFCPRVAGRGATICWRV